MFDHKCCFELLSFVYVTIILEKNNTVKSLSDISRRLPNRPRSSPCCAIRDHFHAPSEHSAAAPASAGTRPSPFKDGHAHGRDFSGPRPSAGPPGPGVEAQKRCPFFFSESQKFEVPPQHTIRKHWIRQFSP